MVRSIARYKDLSRMLRMHHNGPAIKKVNVAERLEVVTRKALLFRAGSRHTTERNEARRGFCYPGTSFLRYTSVAVQISKRAGIESRYTKFNREMVGGRLST
jgi:hypothetical protein